MNERIPNNSPTSNAMKDILDDFEGLFADTLSDADNSQCSEESNTDDSNPGERGIAPSLCRGHLSVAMIIRSKCANNKKKAKENMTSHESINPVRII